MDAISAKSAARSGHFYATHFAPMAQARPRQMVLFAGWLNRGAARQHRLLAEAVAPVTGLLAFGNLILSRICKVMVHLSVQNSLSKGFLQLPKQTMVENIVFGSLSFSS